MTSFSSFNVFQTEETEDPRTDTVASIPPDGDNDLLDSIEVVATSEQDLHAENMDFDISTVETPDFGTMAQEIQELSKVAKAYEDQESTPDEIVPRPDIAAHPSPLSIETKVIPGENLDSPVESEADEGSSHELLDVSSDVNTMKTDMNELTTQLLDVKDSGTLTITRVSALESKFDSLDTKLTNIMKRMESLAESANAHHTHTANAIASIGRKHQISVSPELSKLQQAPIPPETVTHGQPPESAASTSAHSLPVPTPKIDLSEWGL